MSAELTTVPVARTEWEAGAMRSSEDVVAREEPLEIRLAQLPLAVVMRTPGHDEELAWGFLVTEGAVADISEIASVRHCSRSAADSESSDNVIAVTPHPGARLDIERLRRNMFASSSCGICGKASIEAVTCRAGRLEDDTRVDASMLVTLPDRLRSAQPGFALCGGLHAAGLFTPTGELLVAREDIGRHNAVDKVVGWATMRGLALSGHVLVVSGRISFEIAQKAAGARIPIIAAVSAPSSLAIALGEALDLTLVGFVRGQRLCTYSANHRICG